MQHLAIITKAIDEAELNRGLRGADWLADPDNIAIVEGSDVALFEMEGPGIYNAHWLFTSRGRAALCTANAMLAEMFDRRMARVVKGLTPLDCRAARWFNRKLGARSLGIVETVNGKTELFFMDRAMWAERKA